MTILYELIIIFIFGLIFSLITKMLKMPNVIGYLIAGIVIGPFCLKLISFDELTNLEIFTTIALSFISFLIGTELPIDELKKLGKRPFIIAILTAVTTYLFVLVGIYIFSKNISLALILGAIASSTAPPAIMLIIKEYKSKGELTTNILSVIAIDDVVSMILFSLSLMLAKNFNSSNINILDYLEPIKEIGISATLGISLGLILTFISKYIKKDNDIIILVFIFIFAPILICEPYNISPLLTCMIMGFVFINASKKRISAKLIEMFDFLSIPLLLIFFVISATSLDFSLIKSVGIIGIIYIILRTFGKVIGGYLGSLLTKSSINIKKYIGFTLLAQTGLAIGLASTAALEIPKLKNTILTVIIVSSFVFDFIGPFITKACLKKAKEIK